MCRTESESSGKSQFSETWRRKLGKVGLSWGVRILYKYLPPPTDSDPVPFVLRTQTFAASDPRSFNNPFEVRPYFDQERHDCYAVGHESFHGTVSGSKHSLVAGQSMVGMPVENVVGFGDTLNQRFREEIGKRFRVVCLSANPKSTLMWGHYTYIYRGAVIGVDVDDAEFRTGLRSEGFPITYSHDRSITKLPLAFYQFPPVEKYLLTGEVANAPMEPVVSSGVTIFFYQYRQQVEEAYLRCLRTKAESWQYEEEVRFIYELPTHFDELHQDGDKLRLPIPKSAIKEIIIGFNASIPMVEGIARLHAQGSLGDAKLHYTTCHPYLFEVQAHETDAKYLLDYFKIILPSND